MPFPRHLLQAKTFRSEPYMVAMAAVAVGMFIGAWVIGPALTHEPQDAADRTPAQEQQIAAQEPLTYQAMLSRPNPSPYRTPTPNYGSYGAPNYGAAAKTKAGAESSEQIADDESTPDAPAPYQSSSRNYPRFDRHRVY